MNAKGESTFQPYRRVVTPTIIQMETAECAAVSLAIILAYYKKYVPIEELRIACNVTRDGSNAWNIIQSAQSFGLNARGYTIELEHLDSTALPAIIFWKFEHFVVLEGQGKDCFYINDPATGPRSISHEEFDKDFTGVVIEFTKSSTFTPSGEPARLSTLLYKQLKPVKSALIFLFLTQLGLIIPSLALPVLTQIFIDQVFDKHELIWSRGIFLSLLVTILLTASFVFLQEKAFVYLRGKLSLRMSSKILWHLLRLPMPFFSHRYAGEIAYRMNLVNSIVPSLTGNLAFTLLNCLLIFIYGLAIAYYSPLLAIIAAFGVIFNLILLNYISRSRQDSLARYQSTVGKSTAYSFGIIENIETIKSMAMENQYFAQWSGYFTKTLNALKEIQQKDIILGVIPPMINSLIFIALLGVGGVQVLHGDMTRGMFVAVQILLINFITPLISLVGFSQVIQLLKVDLARLDDIMEYPIDPNFDTPQDEKRVSITHKKLDGYVEFNNITYGYSALEPPLIEDVTLKMQPGKTIAIVGTTGCGKSTLAMLLAGLVYPWKGTIRYDGHLRKDLPRQQLTSSIALIEQKPFLFRGTIKDNLTLNNPLLIQEDIIQATQDACIHDEIMARRGGYDLEITENGLNLSGGQRQRLEIARGLLKNPSILILDECTSALDSEVEAKVIKNIHRRGCSILMIAHRLSSIKNCDEICVMDKGHIIARGTHEELKRKCSIYNELVLVEENHAS